MTDAHLELETRDSKATFDVGAALASILEEGDTVLLHGDLGAGKTTLVKGVAAELGVSDVVSSPSFALVNEYTTGPDAVVRRLYHVDLYRLNEESELDSIGFSDYAAPTGGAALVEWPERAVAQLPERYMLVEFGIIGNDSRNLRISFVPDDEIWAFRFARLRARLEGGVADRGGDQGQ